jgi:hypothetical protein
MILKEVKSNLIEMFPNNAEQIEEYIIGIQDYNAEDAYDDITISELEEDFKIFLNFYKVDLEV